MIVKKYRYLIKALKVCVHNMHKHKPVVAVQIKLLGTAAYTAAFIYIIESGFDLSVVKLTITGVAMAYMAAKLKK